MKRRAGSTLVDHPPAPFGIARLLSEYRVHALANEVTYGPASSILCPGVDSTPS